MNSTNIFVKIARAIIWISFGVYLLALISVTLRPSFIGGIRFMMPVKDYLAYNSNFIPFRTIMGYIRAMSDGSMSITIPKMNLIGNIIMLLPLAIYLPFFFRKMRSFRADFLTILGVDFAIEMLQFLFRIGSVDIDDVILNMLGVVLGYAVWKTVVFRLFTKMKIINS